MARRSWQDSVMGADEIIAALGMRPHPEGGHFVETWRGADRGDGRAVGTAIYFLLRAGERSHWHRVDADEVWLYHAGAPLRLSIAAAGEARSTMCSAPTSPAAQRPQVGRAGRCLAGGRTDR